ncbi:acetylcholinesterase-1-like [Dermacentor variabilis]|uniref:acetylcholinesterase-1-like n=1 Tax=Dermacentor variabilis TaxID=34621 RepID=UPI003F5B3258
MGATRLAIFLTAAAAAVAFASGAKIYRPAVYTTSGKLVGLKKEAFGRPIDVFYGIPYAQPPLDELRFQKPVPVTPWKGLRDASAPPFPCKQPDFFVHQNYTIQTRNSTEDCLYLNVWTPARYCRDIKTCGPKAVMVFIHGGAFTYGSSSWSFYDGIHFAATGDVVVVTLNYRVGPFGFFSSRLDGLNGNQGMYDQILALTWVKSNIKHFGGDPELITVFGQSAGAISVGYLLVSPLSRGLFRRAIMESGSPFWMFHDNSDIALQKSFSLANALGCTTGFDKVIDDPQVMACLRSKDAGEIVSVATAVLGPQAETFFPSRDGELFPDDANVLMDAMKSSGVELLIGNNKNEGTYFVYNFLAKGLKFHNLAHITKDELGFYMVLFFRTMLQSGVNEIREFYLDKLNSTDPEVVLQRGSDAVGDFLITCPSRYFAEKYQRKGQPVYYYQFSHKPSFSVWPPWMGATHFDEFPFVFAHVMAFPELVTPEEVALSRQLVEIWTTFAKIGRMPTLGKIAWPRYSAAGPYMVDINLKVLTIKKGPQEENCNFWRRYFKLDG